VLLGKAGSMTTNLGADQCYERLRTGMRGLKLGSRVDASGFRLAKAGRTAIRIRGTFVPQPAGGTVVKYRIEFLPALLLAWAIATPIGLVMLGLLLWLAHESLWELWPLIPITVVVIGANLWVSDRQAHWLVGFVSNKLESA
jgi:hypothetical protein